eukprot:TRINITY_DN192_c0_g1_i1.p1 TRINITY_DN192_c0_g1~~TRINITY_DN192_c0_g1_i1.p1  ORF type:complete len:340 (+),score=72.47 TRINITY_DN192_c0_g1_i1:21-1040(+)
MIEIETAEQFNGVVAKGGGVAVHFWASWCEPSQHMKTVFLELSKQFQKVQFVQVDAEKLSDLSQSLGVQSVPYFVFISSKRVVDKLEGASPSDLMKKVKNLSDQQTSAPTPSNNTTTTRAQPEVDINEKLTKLTNHAPVMLFMKGNPSAPQCGFSSKIVKILNTNKVDYSSFDILSDSAVREGLKKFSNWPTYPQLYANGKLVGGLDIVAEMAEDGSLLEAIPPEALGKVNENDINKRLETLLKSAPVLLFMKGNPSAPQCGFSSKIVKILDGEGIVYKTFDILGDNAVREGLKKYSNWPTYPQLYVNSKLVGGLDIVVEMQAEGELLSAIPQDCIKSK